MAKSNDEDPLTMYIIVRKSLNMSIGKTAAQCAHASQHLQLRFGMLEKFHNNENISSSQEGQFLIYKDWLKAGNSRKVVLEANERDWERVKTDLSIDNIVIIRDAGYTELEPGTETVIGVWPLFKSQRPTILKRLQILT